jgi:hypothetical protein
MPRPRLLLFVLLTSAIAACSASSPTAPDTRFNQLKAHHDDPPPCDSTTLSGYANPNAHC